MFIVSILRNEETARMARIGILQSKVKFEDIDYNKAFRYLTVVGGSKLLDRAGILKLKPRWRGKQSEVKRQG